MFRKVLEMFGLFNKSFDACSKEEREKYERAWEELKQNSTEKFERKVGETFDYCGTTLEVVEDTGDPNYCSGCFFHKSLDCGETKHIRGLCAKHLRKNKDSVKFQPVQKTTFVETSHFAKQPKNLSKFPHYFAKIPNFTHLDIYMVSEMFGLNSYQHHIIKKAIATGKRGSKDQVKDLQEIIATAESWIEFIEANKVL